MSCDIRQDSVEDQISQYIANLLSKSSKVYRFDRYVLNLFFIIENGIFSNFSPLKSWAVKSCEISPQHTGILAKKSSQIKVNIEFIILEFSQFF